MENEAIKILGGSWAMLGGDGPRSYAQNSTQKSMNLQHPNDEDLRFMLGDVMFKPRKGLRLGYRNGEGEGAASNMWSKRGMVDTAKGMINEEILKKLDFNNPHFNSLNTFRIADFGCSAGPNAFLAVENIIDAVEHKYNTQFQNPPPLEFQVFFNDVVTNDFNPLFKTLPSYQKYFAAGLPGSFYARLFPKSTLHLAYSSYALHCLSKVPKDVVDSKSPAWNKGSVQCCGTVKEDAKAYSAQFKNDMDTFLNARAQEIMGGGLMVIKIAGLPDEILMSETGTGITYDIFGSCLIDMAKLGGAVSIEKVDSFNFPLYYSSAKELGEIIESNGHFCIERMDKLNHPMLQTKLNVEFAISQFRAAFQGLVEEHFGKEDVVEKIFQHFAKKLADNYDSIFNGGRHQHVDFFILRKRNIN